MTRRQVLPVLSSALAGCSTKKEAPPPAPMTAKREHFGVDSTGEPVEIFTIQNSKGMEARIATLGGILVSLKVPDHNGKAEDVVLGFDSIDGYLTNGPYFGALIGRYANRIAGGQFNLNGTVYKLAKNNGPNHLHGGVRGFDKVRWRAKDGISVDGVRVELTYSSPDGEEGYPGTLTVNTTYTLTENNELRIDFDATSTKDTIVNLTNHSYFNLAGPSSPDILSHQLTLVASRFTPVNKDLIPTGELKAVEGTPFDFRTPHAIGERIGADDPQIRMGNGYDHNFVIDRKEQDTLVLAARVVERSSGRGMEVHTTEPGVQLYTSNFLDGSIAGKGGKTYGKHAGLCLETQHFPDSPNQPSFPSTVLKQGGRFRSTTSFRFFNEA